MMLRQSSDEPTRLQSRERRHGQSRLLADGLGWFSVGLGLAELVAPATLAQLVGVRDDEDNRAVIKAAGLRELASGIGILGTANPAALLWGRVAGDVMDLLLLAGAASRGDTNRRRLSGATLAVLGVAALDVLGAARHGNAATTRRMHEVARGLPEALAPDHGVRVKAAITINRPREEVYARWRKLDDLPQFMSHLERVTAVDAVRSHWQLKPALGTHIEWDAEVISDLPNKQISWRSLDGASIPNAGSVRFRDAPGERGTELLVELAYHPPGGKLATAFAKLFGAEPGERIKGDLRRFKQVMETGEVVHSDASIHRGAHPGRPAALEEVRS